jgi:hypothetical protein
MSENTRSMIKKGVVSKVSDDSGNYPTFQMVYNGKTAEVYHQTPYGLYSSLPSDNRTLCVTFNAFDSEDNKVGFGNTPHIRFKDLKEGEVVMGNPLTLSKVYFKENGDIDVHCSADNNVNIVGDCNVTVGGNVTINVTGNASVNVTGSVSVESGGAMSATVGGALTADVSGTTTVTCSTVTVDGELRCTGEITSFYGLPTELSFTGVRNIYNTHTHPETGTVTTAPNQQM